MLIPRSIEGLETHGESDPPRHRDFLFLLLLPLSQLPILFLYVSLLRNLLRNPLPGDGSGSFELITLPPLGVPNSSPAYTQSPCALRTAAVRGGDPVRRRQRNPSAAIVRQTEVQVAEIF